MSQLRRLAHDQVEFEAILEATSDFVAITDLVGGLLYVNDAGRRMTGIAAGADLATIAMLDLIAPQAAPRFAFALATAREQGSWCGETTFRALDGREFETSQMIVAHRGASGELQSFSTIARDITRERQSAAVLALHPQILGLVAAGERLPRILDALTRAVEELAEGMLASVLLVDESAAHLRHGSAPSLPDAYNAEIDGIAIGPGVGSCGTAAYRREPVVVVDITSDPLWADFTDLASEHDLRACWSTPICTAEGEVLGTFALYYRRPRAPDDMHLQLIDTATHLARMAIEHDRATRQLRDSEQRFRVVATQVPVGIFQADAAGIYVFANEHLCEIVGCGPDQIHGRGWTELVHCEDRARVVGEWDAAVAAQSSWTSEFRVRRPDGAVRVVAAIGVVLRADDGSLSGFLGSYSDITQRIEAQQRRRELEHEQQIAQTLQRSLLPDRLPRVAGVEIAARYIAGAAGLQVGGDWYDVFTLPDGRLGVTLGDVVGRGLRAAAAMGQLRTALRTIAHIKPSPAAVISCLSELADGDSHMATVVYGTLDPQRRIFEFACAGHPPPLLAPAHGTSKYLQDGRNPPIGLTSADVHSAVVDVGAGATLLLYSDGLIERRGEPIDDGFAALQHALDDHDGDLQSLCDTLITTLGADAVGDDVAILALRLQP